MDFKKYQKQSRRTALYPKKLSLIYPTLGLTGESGEVAEKVKKIYRDHQGKINQKQKEEIKKELGDVLWYLSQIASDLDLDLEDIAETNLAKLFSRKKRGKLHGSGDNR